MFSAASDLCDGLERRVSVAGFDSSDVRAVEIRPLGEHFLRPPLGVAEMANSPAKRFEQRILAFAHRSTVIRSFRDVD